MAVRAQRVPELDRRRAFEVGQAVAAEVDQLGLVGGLPGPQHHQRLDRLSPALARNADDGHLRHRRVLVETVLDLDRADIFPAGDDHVLLPVGDDHVAVRVASRPGRRCGTSRPPGPGPTRPAAPSIPRRRDWSGPGSRRRRPCGSARRAPAPRPATAAGLARTVEAVPLGPGPVDGQQRRRLGQPVDLDELPAQLGLDPLDGLRRGRGPGHDDADAVPPRDRPPLWPAGRPRRRARPRRPPGPRTAG